MTANTVQIMHSTMSTTHIKLCQFRVSVNKIEYNQAIRKQSRTRTNVMLSNEEYQQHSNQFVEQKPSLSPVDVKLDIQAYKSQSPPLKIMMTKEFMKKLTTMIMINPYLAAPTANSGAQVIILGHNHLSKIGLNISCLHRTAAVLDGRVLWMHQGQVGDDWYDSGAQRHGVRDREGHLPPVTDST